MASFGEKLKAFGQKITGTAEPEPETLPQQLLRQVDEATTLTWKQVSTWLAVHARLVRPAVPPYKERQLTCMRVCCCRGPSGSLSPLVLVSCSPSW